MSSISRILSLSVITLLVAFHSVSAGTIKKWVDENGVTHYGKSIPPQYKERAHSELNDRGIAIRHHERSRTKDEIERDKALAALRAEQQRLLEEQQARDRILLNLYRNEDDLIMARDGKIARLDGQIKLTHKEIRRLKARLSEFQAQAARTERIGKTLTDKQRANLNSTRRSIEQSYAIILSKEDEKRVTIERYDFDLDRFRKLRRSSNRLTDDGVKQSGIPDLVDTAVRCTEAQVCDQLWKIAQAYAKQHATTPIDLTADRILVTAPPREGKDISITVSRLNDAKYGGERIFMDVQCVRFSEGREFCRGDAVKAIRSGFREAMQPAADRT